MHKQANNDGTGPREIPVSRLGVASVLFRSEKHGRIMTVGKAAAAAAVANGHSNSSGGGGGAGGGGGSGSSSSSRLPYIDYELHPGHIISDAYGFAIARARAHSQACARVCSSPTRAGSPRAHTQRNLKRACARTPTRPRTHARTRALGGRQGAAGEEEPELSLEEMARDA